MRDVCVVDLPEHRAAGADLGHRTGCAGAGVRPHSAPIPQGDHHDGRRCRRCAHPHPAADLLLPLPTGPDRRGVRVHRMPPVIQGTLFA